MAPPLLALTDIALTFGGTPLLEAAGFAIGAGQRIALVGRNGSGKSTLLRIAAGDIEADHGTRFLQPGATVRYLPQEADLSGFSTVHDYVAAGLGPHQDPFRASWLLGELGLSEDLAVSTLSGGEARRASLARALAPEPDILLLDEPTNHLDLPAIEWLESELKKLKSALVVISHDRRFLENVTRSTVWIDRGVTRALGFGFTAFEAWRDEFLEREERDRHKAGRHIAAEEHWRRYGVTARRKRNVRRLGELMALRQARRDRRSGPGDVTMTVSRARVSGAIVVDAKNLGKSFDGTSIVSGFSTRILRGDRVGIVGPNGAGKTTLLSLLTGKLVPDTGEARLGTGLELAYLDQRRASLDPAATLAGALSGGGSDQVLVNGSVRHVVAYMKDFLFTPDQAGTPVSRLSGGERARLTLARALALPSNFLVLDEPTNDLDLETLDLLQEMVAGYAGTVIVVSHDRDFLDRVATSIIASQGRGRWVEYAGGYTDMLAQRRPGPESVQPKTRRTVNPASARTAAGKRPARPAAPAKLSFKQSHALKLLPHRIDELTAKIAGLSTQLADPGLYGRDQVRFNTLTGALSACQAELAAAEDQWLEIETLRERIEGAGS